MKKTILALSLLFVTQSCFAYLEEGKTADIEMLQDKGYSQATLKMLDRATSQLQGAKGSEHYVRYYSDYAPKNGLAAFYNKAKIYIDPAMNDDYFGKHESDFTNAWFFDLEDSTVKPSGNTNSTSIESL